MHNFSISSKNLLKHAFIFSRVWRKHTICWKFLRKFSKNFIRILLKMHYFSYFSKQINKPCVNFLRVWTKNANCWEILRKIRKIFDENSIEKLNFNFIFNFILNFIVRKFVIKNRAFGNNTNFLQQFFRFRGGGISPFPLATPLPRDLPCKESRGRG